LDKPHRQAQLNPSVSLLSSTFTLHDVRDVESFTGRIVERSGLRLSVEDREELHVYLIETCWEISIRFEPGRISFSSFAGSTLPRRVIDWERQRFGRTKWQFRDRVYERPRVELVSLDADDSEHVRLGPSFAGGSLDDGEHRLADQLRDLDQRSSRPGRRPDWLGDEAA
jgi:hypothetical protein